MYGRHASIAIYNESCRQGFHAAIQIAGLIVAQHNPVVNFLFGHERCDGLPAIVVHGYSNYFEAAIFIFALKIHEPGDLDAARTAPRGPEIQQNDLAPVIRQMDGLPAHILKFEFGSRLSVLAVFNGCVYAFLRAASYRRKSHRGNSCQCKSKGVSHVPHYLYDYMASHLVASSLLNHALLCRQRRCPRVSSESAPE